MSVYLGPKAITAMLLGTSALVSAYLGARMVYRSGPPTLRNLALSNLTIAEASPADTFVAIIRNTTYGSTLTLTSNPGGFFKLVQEGSVWKLATTNVALDYETATSHNIEISEALAGAVGSPKAQSFTISVLDVVEGGPPPGPTMIAPAILSGVPRVDEWAWIYGGAYSTAVTHYRYDVRSNGVSLTGFPQTTTEDNTSFQWPLAAMDLGYSATVAISTDGGTTFSSPFDVEVHTTFASGVITAKTRSVTVTRESTSGAIPTTAALDGKIYASDQFRIQICDTDGSTVLFESVKGVSEAELSSPFVANWSGVTDPAPQPPLPPLSTLSATPDKLVINMRVESADYMPSGNLGTAFLGVLSPWVTFQPSDIILPMAWSTTDKDPSAAVSGTGNLTAGWAGGGSNYGGVRSSRRIPAGAKVHAEFPINNENGIAVGVVDTTQSVSTDWVPELSSGGPSTSHAAAMNRWGQVDFNGTINDGGPPPNTGKTLILEVDDALEKAWWAVYDPAAGGSVSAWFPAGDPAAGTGGRDISAMGPIKHFGASFSFGGSVTANFDGVATPFLVAPSAGFGPA